MIYFLLTIFKLLFFARYSTFATQAQIEKTDMSIDRTVKAKKRKLNIKSNDRKPVLNTKILRTGLNSYVIQNIETLQGKTLPVDAENTFLDLYYHEKPESQRNTKGSIDKSVNITDNFTTYKLPDYTFKIKLTSLMKDNIITANKTINIFYVINIETFINCFTLFFCEIESPENNSTFTVKNEFKFLELMTPEFLPFIYFINKFKNEFEINVYILDFIVKVRIFNDCISEWVHKYYNIFDSEFISENAGNINLKLFLKNLNISHKMHFLEFKYILADLLEIINADKNLIKNYKFLIKHHNYSFIKKRQGFAININLFIYFIICAGNKRDVYLEKFNKYNHILDMQLLTDTEMQTSFRFIYYTVDLEIFKSTIREYNQMIRIFKMPSFVIQDHLNGQMNFKTGKFIAKYFYYDQQGDKYAKRIYFLVFYKLLYLNFLRQVLLE